MRNDYPAGIAWHNPHKVTPEEVTKGWRLLHVSELGQYWSSLMRGSRINTPHGPSDEVFFRSCCSTPPLDPQYTYAIPESYPLPEKYLAPEQKPVGTVELEGATTGSAPKIDDVLYLCPHCFSNFENDKARLMHQSFCESRKKNNPSSPLPPSLSRQIGGDHYKSLAIQPAEYCHRNKIGKLEGDVIAYVTRWRAKGGIKDLQKARHTLEILIELECNPAL